MGSCISCISSVGGHVLPAPMSGVQLTNSEVYKIINSSLKITDNTRIKLADRGYYAISLLDIKKFLLVDASDLHKYKPEIFDCDDFAVVLLGRNREWFSKVNMEFSSTFGIVVGDIRRNETDTEPRYHAMNFIITNEKKLFLIEPQNDSVYEPTSNSIFTFAWC